MIRYLLGELNEGERIEFEDVCFANDQHFEELLAVEVELTDDYVRGDLVGLRRERFEKQLLKTAEGPDDVEFARIIAVTPAPTPRAAVMVDRDRSDWRSSFAWIHSRGRAFQVALATLALVFVGLALWLIWSSPQPHSTPQQAVQNGVPENAKPQESPPAPTQSPSPAPSLGEQRAGATPERSQRDPGNVNGAPEHEGHAIISLLVVPGFDRSAGGANDLVIPKQARTVRLQLALENNNYQSYGAVLRSVEGKEILNRRGLKGRSTRSGNTVTLEFPAGSFPQGDFILTLSGTTSRGEVEDVHKYFLSVSKK